MLTFNTPQILQKIKIGYNIKLVEIYTPDLDVLNVKNLTITETSVEVIPHVQIKCGSKKQTTMNKNAMRSNA